MDSELFEKNIGKLVRQAALPTADVARAREKFLRAAEPAPRGRSWGLALSAAGLLIVALLYSTLGVKRVVATPPEVLLVKPFQETPPAPGMLKGSGGNKLLRGTLKMERADSGRWKFVFQGRSPLAEGLNFRLQGQVLEESFDGRRLVPQPTHPFNGVARLENGAFEMDWTSLKGGPLQLLVTIPDDLQEQAFLTTLTVPSAERTWVFTYQAWDDRLLAKIESQYHEIVGLILEAQQLVGSVAAPTVVQPRPEDDTTSRSVPVENTMNALMLELRKLLSRLQGFSVSGLYPASTRHTIAQLQDITGAIPYFKWKDGKFAGVQDYHRQNAPGEFSFQAIFSRLDTAAVIAGREFDLWILRDTARGGLRRELVEAVTQNSTQVGIRRFAEALKAGTAKEEDLRQIVE